MSELVEKVARKLAETDGPNPWEAFVEDARAVIAIIREEAARIADTHHEDDAGPNADLCEGCGEMIAAAIRKMA